MAAPIQMYLLVLVVTVNGHEIPLNFLDRILDEPLPTNVNRPRYPYDIFGLNFNIPHTFGPEGRHRLDPLKSKTLYNPQYLYNGSPSGDTTPPEATQNNVYSTPQSEDTDSIKAASQDKLSTPISGLDDVDTKSAVRNTLNTADKLKEIDDEHTKIDKGPLKVELLPVPEPISSNEESVLKTNINTETKPVVEPLLLSSLEQTHGNEMQTLSNENVTCSESVNITQKNDNIVFPDQFDHIKTEINRTLQNNNNKTNTLNYLHILDDRLSKDDMKMNKNMEAVLIPVQVIPSQVPVLNMGVNSNSNMFVPLRTNNGQVSQVLPITNDIFPMTTTQKSNLGEQPIQGILYTNILRILSQNGAQQAVMMPATVSNPNINNVLSNPYPNNLNENVGVPSGIPQNPVIAKLLTPANIQNVGSGSSNLVYNTQRASTPNNLQSIQPPSQTYILQNFGQQTVPNNKLNTQNTQYYLVNGNINNQANLNNNNGKPLVLSLPGNLASIDPNVVSTDNTQKYMLVTVNNQQNVPSNNIYTLTNLNGQTSNANALLVNGGQQSSVLLNANSNNSGQSNLYTLVTLPSGLMNSGNNVAVNPSYQTPGTQGFSLVRLREGEGNDEKSLENHNLDS